MRVITRLHLVAAVLGFTLIVPAHLSAQDSRRDREERLREDRLREERLRESRLREDRLDRLREERLRAELRRDDHFRDRDMSEAIRERVEAALRRSHDAIDRVEMNRFQAEELSRIGVDVRERVREALERSERVEVDRVDHLDRLERLQRLERLDRIEPMRRLEHNDWSSVEARRLADEIRARVRESLERSEGLRERSYERAMEEARRNELRLRDRRWY